MSYLVKNSKIMRGLLNRDIELLPLVNLYIYVMEISYSNLQIFALIFMFVPINSKLLHI